MVVVVHVHVREPGTTLGQVVDEILCGLSFLCLVVRPERLEPPTTFVVAFDEPKQEKQANVGFPERVAFVVQEDVAVIRCRKRGEAGQLRLHQIDIDVGCGQRVWFKELERWWAIFKSVARLDL